MIRTKTNNSNKSNKVISNVTPLLSNHVKKDLFCLRSAIGTPYFKTNICSPIELATITSTKHCVDLPDSNHKVFLSLYLLVI